MAASVNEVPLKTRAEDFVLALAEAGFRGRVVPESLSEYGIKVAVSSEGKDLGLAVVFYKPKAGTFKLVLAELRDSSSNNALMAVWNRPRDAAGKTAPDLAIYVDGSYQEGVACVGWAAVICANGSVTEELSGTIDDTSQRQVLGELEAATQALSWCQRQGHSAVVIYCDYEGVAAWATGAWKAKNNRTCEYAEFVHSSNIKIDWQKVAAHSGDSGNERADALARLALTRKASGSSADAATVANPEEQLKTRAQAFCDHLVAAGYSAAIRGFYNRSDAQISLARGGNSLGVMHLYLTAKSPLSLKLHDVRADTATLASLEAEWQDFLGNPAGTKAEDLADGDGLVAVDHYNKILLPFAGCDFDFIQLAEAVAEACRYRNRLVVPVDELRYDYTALQAQIQALRC